MASPSSDARIQVAVSGATGRMGQEVVKAVLADPALKLVAAVDPGRTGEDAALAAGLAEPCGVTLQASLDEALATANADACVDFTRPDVVFQNAMTMVRHHVRPVIGTTGLTEEGLKQLSDAISRAGLSGAVIPNFALGAVLMMKFAREAARYFEHAEIIEYHHNKKADAPSGTSLLTAAMMRSERPEGFGLTNAPEEEVFAGARGGSPGGGLRVHSVRLPGMVAHQEVLFGSQGQLLTLRHDSFDRVSFMPGVVLAIKRLQHREPGLVVGLETLL
jgi:4-hydroxy-tetrahydrodipicolinate reductase